MRLIVLGSSSKGNCYLLDNGKEALMIECGIAMRDVQIALGFDMKRIQGVLVTHEHGDHAKHAHKLAQRLIPLYMSQGTATALEMEHDHVVNVMQPHQTVTIGGFKVQPFDTQHDAAQPFGFLIHHPECGFVLFATDTYYLRYTFQGLNNILLECNYKQEILDANVEADLLPVKLRNRTMKSHMEFEQCKETLLANDLSNVNNIVLIHLSEGNGDPQAFKQGIEEATGKNVTIARPGLKIDKFNKTPF